mmetsp:Transcript_13049/g.38045  ORF Transcript_13049/g.38045 Transcript_13049/m.38045 type:complete len:96 (-) Transcript_13049:276-563(-)
MISPVLARIHTRVPVCWHPLRAPLMVQQLGPRHNHGQACFCQGQLMDWQPGRPLAQRCLLILQLLLTRLRVWRETAREPLQAERGWQMARLQALL